WSYNTFSGDQAFHHYDARGHCTLLTDSLGNILGAIRIRRIWLALLLRLNRSTTQLLNRWKPLPLHWPRMVEWPKAIRLSQPNVPTGAGPLPPARPERVRRWRLQPLPLLPQ